MIKSTPLATAALATLFAQAFSLSLLKADSSDRPNIVLIIADDLGYGETGMQGNQQIPTPGIDALAKSGVRCTAGYVTSSYCSPSRAGILTGRFQSRFGYDMNPTGKRNLLAAAGLPVTETTFISELKHSGYRTALIGKWHLGASEAKQPLARGFDSFYGFLHEGHYYVPGPPYENVYTMLRSKSVSAGEMVRSGDLFRGNYTGNDEPAYDDENPLVRGDKSIKERDYLTDAITHNAVEYIHQDHASPLALVVSYNAVHSPMQARKSDVDQVYGINDPQRKIFAAMLIALDRGVAAITAALQERGLIENTLIVFVSDNGGPTKELTSSNAPLRGGKGDLYEGGIRVPMIWSMPGTLPADVAEPRVVLSLDVAATALDMAGLESDVALDGVNVMPFLSGKRLGAMHDRVYWRMQGGKTALRQGDWKIVRPSAKEPFELYHLAADISETNNLAADQPTKLRELVHAWLALDSEMAEPIELP